jgi:nitrogen regulatory protein P-II 2
VSAIEPPLPPPEDPVRTTVLKLVTIVAEAILEDQLLGDLRRLGSTGHSIGQVRGEGSRGVRASEWEGSNVRIETIVAPTVADAILDHVAATYFEHYAVVAYIQDVEVARGDKYVREKG